MGGEMRDEGWTDVTAANDGQSNYFEIDCMSLEEWCDLTFHDALREKSMLSEDLKSVLSALRLLFIAMKWVGWAAIASGGFFVLLDISWMRFVTAISSGILAISTAFGIEEWLLDKSINIQARLWKTERKQDCAMLIKSELMHGDDANQALIDNLVKELKGEME